MNANRRVLFVSYYFPPIASSGVFRSLGFARHLVDFGWDPVVLTVADSKDSWAMGSGVPVPEGVEIHRTPEIDLGWLPDKMQAVWRRVLALGSSRPKMNPFREVFCMPDQQAGWRFTELADDLAEGCDCIYVSSTPYSAALKACLTRRRTDKPLVVDFRDPWMADPAKASMGLKLPNRLRAWMEAIVVSECDRLILNTPDAEALYRRLYPAHAAKMLNITNGFDELNLANRIDSSERIRIVHTGSFYYPRTPSILLAALEAIGDERIEFVHIGPTFGELDNYTGPVRVTQVGTVSRDKVAEYLREASILYLNQGFDQGPGRYTAIAAKTYEYLATGLPILIESPGGDNSDLVEQYAEKAYFVLEKSEQQMVEALRQAIDDLPSVEPVVSEEFKDRFHRRNLTEKLARVFDGVVRTENPDRFVVPRSHEVAAG